MILDVSVIFIIGYDNEITFHSLESALRQNISSFEIIVVNNTGSELKAFKNIKYYKKIKYLKKIKKIKYFKFDNKKEIFFARNFALSKAKAKYISILDSDDFYKINHLKLALNLLKKKEADFYYSSYLNLKLNSKNFEKRECTKNLNKFDLLTFCPIGHSTVVFKKDFIQKYFPIRYRHDLATWSRLHEIDKSKIVYDKNITVIRTINDKNFSKNKLRLLKYYYIAYRKAFKLSILNVLIYLNFLLLRHTLNKFKNLLIFNQNIFDYKEINQFKGLKNILKLF